MTKERTSTEQIIIWVGLIANSVIAIILTVQIVTIYCKIAGIKGAIGTSGKPIADNNNDLERELGVLTGRVAALESDLLAMRMGLNPCTAIAKKEDDNDNNESDID